MTHHGNAAALPDDRESPERDLLCAVFEQWGADLHSRDADAIQCVRWLASNRDHRSGVSAMVDAVGMDPGTVIAGLRRLADDAEAAAHVIRLLQPGARLACDGSASGQSVTVVEVFDVDAARFRAHVVEARRVARKRWPGARVAVEWEGENDG